MPPSKRSTDRQTNPLCHWLDSGSQRLRAALAARIGAETGSASLEFLTVGLIMLVPLVYLVLALAAVQAGSFAVEGAARHAARIAVQSGASGHAASRNEAVQRAVAVTLADYGIDAGDSSVALACGGTGCDSPGSRITVTVRARVSLPLVPDVLATTPISSVQLESRATQTVSRFGGGE